MKKTETRVMRNLTARVRAASDEGDGGAVIEGVAVEYGQRSENLGGFVEIIAPGAFGDLSDRDVIATAHHDNRMILGRTPDTLELDNDEKRLAYSFEAPDTNAGRDTVESLKRGDIRGSSFTFFINGGLGHGEDLEELDDGVLLRTVTDATLIEVAPVVHPAYPQTSVEVAKRSIEMWLEERKAKLEEEGELEGEALKMKIKSYERRLELMRI